MGPGVTAFRVTLPARVLVMSLALAHLLLESWFPHACTCMIRASQDQAPDGHVLP